MLRISMIKQPKIHEKDLCVMLDYLAIWINLEREAKALAKKNADLGISTETNLKKKKDTPS